MIFFLLLYTAKLKCEMEATTSWLAAFLVQPLHLQGVVTGASLNALNILQRYLNIGNCRWAK